MANKDNNNSSLEYYCQVGDPSDVRLRATLALFAQIANEPCFDQLRTKEQLGYLVFSGARTSVGQMGFRIIVQSERDSEYLQSRINAFLDQLMRQLLAMSDDEFEAHRASLIHKRQESVKNLAEETQRFWKSIHSGYFDFLHRQRDVQVMETLRKDDIVAFMQHYIHPSSIHRAKTVTHIQAQAVPSSSKPLSSDALDSFFAFLSSQGVEVPAEAREALGVQLTSVESLQAFAKDVAASGELPPSLTEEALLACIAQAVEKHPKEADASAMSLPEAPPEALPSVDVREVQSLKQSLQSSQHALPVLPWDVYASEPHAPIDESQYTPAASMRANT